MKHKLNIIVTKKPKNVECATFRQISGRERLMRFIFGDEFKPTVIIPKNIVDKTNIKENRKYLDDKH